jgi:type VI secretion system protein ImpK
MAAASLAVVALAYFLFLRQLSANTDRYTDQGGIPPLHMPVIARPVIAQTPPPRHDQQSVFSARLHRFLQPEIDAKLVVVTETTPQRTEVRIFNGGMFDSGSATVHDAFVPLLIKIGDALNDEQGMVVITGHTDDQPIHTIQFPSNYELSAARAQAAAAIMAQRLRDPSRVTVKGLANMVPIDTSPTDAARRLNRRIEIILIRQG